MHFLSSTQGYAMIARMMKVGAKAGLAVQRHKMSHRTWHRLRATVTALLLTISVHVSHGDDMALADASGRIEYDFYAQESRDLAVALTTLSKQESHSESSVALSWLNYGRWKLALLLKAKDSAQAEANADQCLNQTWPKKMRADAQAVAAALQAACAQVLAELRVVRRPLYRRDRERLLDQALQLSDKSPQVLLIAAHIALADDQPNVAYDYLQRSFASFDAREKTGQQPADNWGQAEVSYLLGKLDLQRGDRLAARNELERAVVLANDYRDAQQLLKSLRL